MKVEQIHDLMNQVTKEVLGETAVVSEDLSNIVDLGKQIQDSQSLDNYVHSLVDHIGKVIFVNRPYSGNVISMLRDGWDYGSILEKITVNKIPEAEDNEMWELKDGASYDPNIFYKPDVSAKFFNDRVGFDIQMSITADQVKSSFDSVEQYNGFVSMIYNAIDRSLTIKTDKLIMETLATGIAETIHSDYPTSNYTEQSGVKAVNLLYLYNQRFGTTLTKEQALTTPEFIRFASYIMGLYKSRLSKVSSLFNVGGMDRFTSADMLHFVLLADFANAAQAYLQSDTYHDEFVALPNAEIVPFWQGSGKDYGLASTSKIDVKTPENNTISIDGILGVMFDHDAMGVANLQRKVTSQYNPKADFWNTWYHNVSGHFCDLNENIVVFFVA